METFKTWLSRRQWSATPATSPAMPAPFDDGLVELARLIAVERPELLCEVSSPELEGPAGESGAFVEGAHPPSHLT